MCIFKSEIYAIYLNYINFTFKNTQLKTSIMLSTHGYHIKFAEQGIALDKMQSRRKFVEKITLLEVGLLLAKDENQLFLAEELVRPDFSRSVSLKSRTLAKTRRTDVLSFDGEDM